MRIRKDIQKEEKIEKRDLEREKIGSRDLERGKKEKTKKEEIKQKEIGWLGADHQLHQAWIQVVGPTGAAPCTSWG